MGVSVEGGVVSVSGALNLAVVDDMVVAAVIGLPVAPTRAGRAVRLRAHSFCSDYQSRGASSWSGSKSKTSSVPVIAKILRSPSLAPITRTVRPLDFNEAARASNSAFRPNESTNLTRPQRRAMKPTTRVQRDARDRVSLRSPWGPCIQSHKRPELTWGAPAVSQEYPSKDRSLSRLEPARVSSDLPRPNVLPSPVVRLLMNQHGPLIYAPTRATDSDFLHTTRRNKLNEVGNKVV